MIEALYCDGGVIGPNPSKLGGTWAWCLVAGGEIVRFGSGIVAPDDVGVEAVTNNHTELIAAIRALSAVHPGWRGVIHSDSLVTIRRMTGRHASFNGVPPAIESKAHAIRRRMTLCGRVRFVLLGGHPTKEELRVGRNRKGHPTSKWNCWADEECNRLAAEFRLRETGGRV